MTPRRALVALLLAGLFVVSGLAAAQDNTTDENAGGGAAAGIDFAVSILPVENPNSWSVKEITARAGSRVTLVYNHMNSQQPHNLHVYEPDLGATRCCLQGEDAFSAEVITITIPASGEVKYKCDVHPEMVGVIKVGETFAVAGAGGAPSGEAGGHTGIVALGVDYLAYWVAVIAFAVLFIIYGLTFFLFKHGESNATTDHMDRPGAAVGGDADNRVRGWLLVGVTILIVVGGLVLTFMNMPQAG